MALVAFNGGFGSMLGWFRTLSIPVSVAVLTGILSMPPSSVEAPEAVAASRSVGVTSGSATRPASPPLIPEEERIPGWGVADGIVFDQIPNEPPPVTDLPASAREWFEDQRSSRISATAPPAPGPLVYEEFPVPGRVTWGILSWSGYPLDEIEPPIQAFLWTLAGHPTTPSLIKAATSKNPGPA